MTESMGIYFKGQLVGLMQNCDCPGGYDDIDVKIKPVIILDRATVELVIQALEVAWANDDDGIYEHALKAVGGEK